MIHLSERIARIAQSAGDSVVLRQGHQSMTFSDLSARADQLAFCFLNERVTRDAVVAIALDRSFDWIVAALGAMRAGCAYLPLDPSWPPERMRFALEDSAASIVVAPEALLAPLAAEAIGVDPVRDATRIAEAPACALPQVTRDDLAYIIYTSGSTGVPKGVEVTHSNLAHLVDWHRTAFAITAADRCSHLAGLGFDASAWEIWPTLASGATLVLPGDDLVRTSPELLERWLVEEGINVAFVPTPLAASMIVQPWPTDNALRLLLTGGDTLQRSPRPGLPFPVVNNYGPTECTVVATSGVVEPASDTVPSIGRAIPGTSVYVLDEQGAEVAPSQPGELYIGGAGVARGYRNLPELSASSFLPDPFSSLPGARMYRTGDWGIRLPSGEIAFLGRLDSQEKIRGQRVELDEIASVLHRHPAVAFAVVTTNATASGEKHLLAHVLPADSAQPTAAELQRFLAETLPGYMIPAAFVRLRALPLTASGKVDRTLLEAPTPVNALSEPVAGRAVSPIEEKLLSVAQELLGTENLRIDEDFFLVGGHSLLGTQLVLRVRDIFGVELNLRHLFEAGTVERLARTVEELLIAQIDSLSDEEALLQVRE